MFSFDVNQSLVPPGQRLTRQLLAKLSKTVATLVPGSGSEVVEVSFVSDQDIRRLNRMYRGQDKVTDVLSFINPESKRDGILGEIMISYPQAIRQAEDDDIELELADLLVHGLLHLMGYDHERPADAEDMFPLQDAIVAKIL